MSNRRFILFFIVGIILTGGLLVFTETRARRTAPGPQATVLCSIKPADVDECSIKEGGKDAVRIVREADGGWRIKDPFEIVADASAVMRLIDVLTLVQVEDMRSDGELLEMGETLRRQVARYMPT